MEPDYRFDYRQILRKVFDVARLCIRVCIVDSAAIAKASVVTVKTAEPVANDEFEHEFQTNTVRFRIKCRELSEIKFNFVSGFTTEYYTIPRGREYNESNLLLDGLKIYMKADVPNAKIEIQEWTS